MDGPAGDRNQKTTPSTIKTLSDQIGWRGLAEALAVVIVIGVALAIYFRFLGDKEQCKYLFAFLIGSLLGLTEILGRYTDSPIAAMKSPGAVIYILVNALASVVALYLLVHLAKETVKDPIYQVLIAGIGAMAFLRSAIFKAKVGGEDIPVGPAIILDTLLKFADAQVDRGRAEERAQRIAEVIQSLPLAHAGVDLPRLCFALMQNLALDVRQRVLDDITIIVTDTKRSEPVKVMEIGLMLWSRVGIGTLTGAVALLKNSPYADRPVAEQLGAVSNIVPPTPQGSPGDLLPAIRQQLEQDRQAVAEAKV